MASNKQKLSNRAKLTYSAHLFKAIFKNYHHNLITVFKPYIPDDAVIIDVGAHSGQFSKLFTKLAPNGHIYAFEPASYTRSILKIVKKLRCLKNVEIIPLGLGDKAGELSLNIPIKSSGSLGFGLSHIGEINEDKQRETYQETIKIITLDDFAEKNNLTRVDFIKADIEGWELRMLAGAEKIIAKYKPSLFLEINDKFLGRAGDSAKDMLEFLQKHDYKILKLEHDGKEKTPSELKDATAIDASNINASELKGDILCISK